MAMVNVRLYGQLRQFGRDFRIDVNSKREVIDMLTCQLKGFKQFLMEAESKGLRFAIFEDKKNLSEAEINHTAAEGRTIRIAPIIVGSKAGGLFQTIIGAALIAVGTFVPGAQFLIPAGIALVAGGVAQMLSPTPKLPVGYEQDGNVASYGFGGAVTTTAQGNPVALIYGEREVGGAVISAGVYSENEA